MGQGRKPHVKPKSNPNKRTKTEHLTPDKIGMPKLDPKDEPMMKLADRTGRDGKREPRYVPYVKCAYPGKIVPRKSLK